VNNLREYICTNRECHFKCNFPLPQCPLCAGALAPVEQREQHWLIALAEDESCWHVSAFDDLPSVIAHEYRRLRELCMAEEPYGLLLKIKDLIETILKYQVLSICAWAKENNVPGFREQVAVEITTESLSLGAWKTMGDIIRRFFSKSDTMLPAPMARALEVLLTEYQKKNFIMWRNEKIGHGAMGFSDDEAFRTDIREKVNQLRQLLVMMGDELTEQMLYLGDRPLAGWQNARELEPEEGQLSIRCGRNGICFDVTPYIVLRKGNVFFFDNQKRIVISQMQCYPNGKRINERNAYFGALRRQLEQRGVGKKTQADGAFMLEMEENYLQRLALTETFIEPVHITQWLKDCLNQADKGVFLLQMCRGTGKSTYTEMISTLNRNPLMLADDLEVRTFHFQRSQLLNTDAFEQRVERQWAQSFDVNGWANPPRMADFRQRENLSPAEALARFLERAREFYHLRQAKERILFVLDGLDEITSQALWEYIPSADMLTQGVYILLTSRDPAQEADAPAGLQERVASLQISEAYTAALRSDKSIDFLYACLQRNGVKGLQTAECEAVFRLADFRVLYLGMLCKLLRDGVPVHMLPDADVIISRYLEILTRHYGERNALLLREILAFLCTWGACEPVSLREIALALGDGEITLEMLGVMNDILPLLNVTRGYAVDGVRYMGRNRYALINETLTEAVRTSLGETRELVLRCVTDMIQTLLHEEHKPCTLTTESEAESDIQLLLLAHMRECMDLTEIAMEEVVNDQAVWQQGCRWLRSRKKLHRLTKPRMVKAVQWVEACQRCLDAQGVKIQEEERVWRYATVAETYWKQGCYQDAIRLFRKAVHLFEKWDEERKVANQDSLCLCYRLLTQALKGYGDEKMAKEACDKLMAFEMDLEGKGRLWDGNRRQLVKDYCDLAQIHNNPHYLAKAVDLFGRQRSEGLYTTEQQHIFLISITYAFMTLGQYERSARFCLEAIEWMEKHPHEDSWGNVELTYYLMARLMDKTKRFSEVAEYARKAIAIMEEKDREDRLMNRMLLAQAYTVLARGLVMTKPENAKYEEYPEEIKYEDLFIRARERKPGDLEFRWLTKDKAHNAKVYCAAENATPADSDKMIWVERMKAQDLFEEELGCYRKAIAIQEQMAQSGKPEDRQLLLGSFLAAAGFLRLRGSLHEALEYYDKSIYLMEEEGYRYRRDEKRNKLYETLKLRELTKNRLEAGAFERIAKQKRELRIVKEEQRPQHANHLALARKYSKLASSLFDMKDYKQALYYYTGAACEYQTADAEGMLKNRDNLAIVYGNVAHSHKQLKHHKEAIKYYRRALEIKKELRAAGQLKDDFSMAPYYHALGELLLDESSIFSKGQLSEAIDLLEKAKDIRQKMRNAGQLKNRNTLVASYQKLAEAYDLAEVYLSAAEKYQQALQLMEEMKLDGKAVNRFDMIASCKGIAKAMHFVGNEEAHVRYRELALQIREELCREGSKSAEALLANEYKELARIYDDGKQYRKAADCYRKAIEVYEQRQKEGKYVNPDDLGWEYAFLINALEKLQDYPQMIAACRQAIIHQEKKALTGRDDETYRLGALHRKLGRALTFTGAFDEALASYQVIADRLRDSDKDLQELADIYRELAEIHEAMNEPEKSIDDRRQMILCREKQQIKDDRWRKTLLADYRDMLCVLERTDADAEWIRIFREKAETMKRLIEAKRINRCEPGAGGSERLHGISFSVIPDVVYAADAAWFAWWIKGSAKDDYKLFLPYLDPAKKKLYIVMKATLNSDAKYKWCGCGTAALTAEFDQTAPVEVRFEKEKITKGEEQEIQLQIPLETLKTDRPASICVKLALLCGEDDRMEETLRMDFDITW